MGVKHLIWLCKYRRCCFRRTTQRLARRMGSPPPARSGHPPWSAPPQEGSTRLQGREVIRISTDSCFQGRRGGGAGSGAVPWTGGNVMGLHIIRRERASAVERPAGRRTVAELRTRRQPPSVERSDKNAPFSPGNDDGDEQDEQIGTANTHCCLRLSSGGRREA